MSVDLVTSIKADLEARGVDLSGPCGAFEITQRVAWALRDQRAGLLDKPSGTNCRGYSTDYVVFLNGPAFDILGDAGGANNPSWRQDNDASLLARWRPPIDPGDAPPDPIEQQQSVLDAVATLQETVDASRQEAQDNQAENRNWANETAKYVKEHLP